MAKNWSPKKSEHVKNNTRGIKFCRTRQKRGSAEDGLWRDVGEGMRRAHGAGGARRKDENGNGGALRESGEKKLWCVWRVKIWIRSGYWYDQKSQLKIYF